MYTVSVRLLSGALLISLLTVANVFAFQEFEKPSKLVLQRNLEQEFVSPCCYREAVATHRSGQATQVKEEISDMLDMGKTPSEVTATLVTKYGERILIKPTTEGFNLLAWIGPFIMLAIGFVVVGVWLYRFRPRGGSSELHVPDEEY